MTTPEQPSNDVVLDVHDVTVVSAAVIPAAPPPPAAEAPHSSHSSGAQHG